ncbi:MULTISPECIES: AraC family transcriptional regulator [unclassified Paenibacillus]|uniref:AraC family transcriptional regulator n=1 Tax=unclassified Paenibacillus TaxID=185978 RepID=UPI0009AC3F8F|nr:MULTISPECIES: AraC family transcriptional regulator [unclassified Paenibacillus]MBE1441891.1 AraC-like DNA-binding protein [Paenibacillus sp. OAS669]
MRRQRSLPTLLEHGYFCLPESVGWYQNDAGHTVERQEGALNNFSIHLVTSGKGYVYADNELHTLQAGDSFLYFPLQQQRYYSSPDDPWDVRWLHFYGSKVKDYLIETGLHRSHIWSIRQPKPLEQAMHDLLVEAEENAFFHLTKLSTLTYAVIAEFVNQAVPLSTSKNEETTNRIVQLLPRLQQEACKPFDLDYWAREAGVSTYYFCKLFKKTTQMTPMTFVTLSRLQMSKQWLLEKSELTVRQIALEAGYPSTSYFNKKFLEQEGMTPTEYRELYWNK